MNQKQSTKRTEAGAQPSQIQGKDPAKKLKLQGGDGLPQAGTQRGNQTGSSPKASR